MVCSSFSLTQDSLAQDIPLMSFSVTKLVKNLPVAQQRRVLFRTNWKVSQPTQGCGVPGSAFVLQCYVQSSAADRAY